MATKAITVSTRLFPEDVKEIEEFTKKEHLDKATFIRKLIHKALQEYKVEHALDLYKEGKVSLWKAAEIAGRNLWEMIEILSSKGMTINYDLQELEKDLKRIKKC